MKVIKNDIHNRIEWIDVAKAIGIIFVIIGHTQPWNNLRLCIYSFHMPLFFIISGIFINMSLEKEYFLYKKVKSLLLPCFIWSIIYYASDVIRHGANYPFVLGHRNTWFLISLFFSVCLCHILLRLCRFNKCIIIMMLYFIAFFVKIIDFHSFCALENVFICSLFVMIGYSLKKIIFAYNKIPTKFVSISNLIILSFCFVLVCIYKPITDLCLNLYPSIPFLVITVIEFFCVKYICIQITRVSYLNFFLSYIGRNSLTLIGFTGLNITEFLNIPKSSYNFVAMVVMFVSCLLWLFIKRLIPQRIGSMF